MHRNLAFLPISEKIEWLKQHNAVYSQAYCSPDQELSRQLYLAQHPTRIAAFKCMDGRINLPIVTSKPFGIIDNLDEPIKMAFSIIEANMQKRHISDDGFVLLTSAAYSRQGADKQRAMEKAEFLSAFARDVAA
jgi:hypothetical protein